MPSATDKNHQPSTVIFQDIDDACQRCGKHTITTDGRCRNCNFKCWYAYS